MKRQIKKLITVSLITSIAVQKIALAETMYTPGASLNSNNGPAFDNSLQVGILNNRVTSEMANTISQIPIASDIVAEPKNMVVETPTIAATPYTSVSVVSPGEYNESISPMMSSSQNEGYTKFADYTELNPTKNSSPKISGPTYAIINVTTKKIYAANNQSVHYEPAGLANIMTAILAAKKLKMTDVLPVKNSAVKGIDKDAAIAALNDGDTITLKDALASMFVKGCVDSANVVAEAVSGSIDEFVKLMNDTAKEIGLTNTYFVNPSGINNESQQTSSLDMAILMGIACENAELIDLMKLTQYTLPKAKRREKLILYSRNSHMSNGNANYNPDIVCSRMGYNKKAMYNVASMINYKDNILVAVVLKSNGTQFADTKKIFEFAKLALDEDIALTTAPSYAPGMTNVQ